VAIVLGDGQYGKAEVRLLRVNRDGDAGSGLRGQARDLRGQHSIRDLNVTVTLSGDVEASYLSGDNSGVLTTDAQKNTVFAFAKTHGVDEIEDFALLLARHFTDSQPVARVHIAQYPWERVRGHSFARSGRETRTATVTCRRGQDEAWVVSGLEDLTLLNTAGSEFRGFERDAYTTLQETDDRILATAVRARWRHIGVLSGAAWGESHAAVRDLLVTAFADTYSHSLQETLFAMGQRVLAKLDGIAEIRLSLPNKHHFEVDLSPFGLANGNEVFYAADRPYGLIEGTVTRDDAPPAGLAW
jgi:urate oxidase